MTLQIETFYWSPLLWILSWILFCWNWNNIRHDEGTIKILFQTNVCQDTFLSRVAFWGRETAPTRINLQPKKIIRDTTNCLLLFHLHRTQAPRLSPESYRCVGASNRQHLSSLLLLSPSIDCGPDSVLDLVTHTQCSTVVAVQVQHPPYFHPL